MQKHLTLSDHGYLGYAVMVNRKFWAGLPADIRSQLAQAMGEATAFEKTIAERANALALTRSARPARPPSAPRPRATGGMAGGDAAGAKADGAAIAGICWRRATFERDFAK